MLSWVAEEGQHRCPLCYELLPRVVERSRKGIMGTTPVSKHCTAACGQLTHDADEAVSKPRHLKRTLADPGTVCRCDLFGVNVLVALVGNACCIVRCRRHLTPGRPCGHCHAGQQCSALKSHMPDACAGQSGACVSHGAARLTASRRCPASARSRAPAMHTVRRLTAQRNC